MNIETLNLHGTKTGRISCHDVAGHKSNTPKDGGVPAGTVTGRTSTNERHESNTPKSGEKAKKYRRL